MAVISGRRSLLFALVAVVVFILLLQLSEAEGKDKKTDKEINERLKKAKESADVVCTGNKCKTKKGKEIKSKPKNYKKANSKSETCDSDTCKPAQRPGVEDEIIDDHEREKYTETENIKSKKGNKSSTKTKKKERERKVNEEKKKQAEEDEADIETEEEEKPDEGRPLFSEDGKTLFPDAEGPKDKPRRDRYDTRKDRKSKPKPIPIKPPDVGECTEPEQKWTDINACAKKFFEDTEKYDFKEFNIVSRTWKKICADNYQPWRRCYKTNINPCPHLYARYRTELRTEADVMDRVKDKCEKNKDPKKNPYRPSPYPRRPTDHVTPTPDPSTTTARTERTTRPWKRRKWNTCDDFEDRKKEFDLCTREFAEKLRESTDKQSLCQDYNDMKNCHTREAGACTSLVRIKDNMKKDPRGVYHNMDHIRCENHQGYDPDFMQWSREHGDRWDFEPIPPPTFSWENREQLMWVAFWTTMAALPVIGTILFCYFFRPWDRREEKEE